MTSMANCPRFSARRPIYRFRMTELGFREVRIRAPRLSADVTTILAPSDFAAANMARETCSGERRVIAQMVEPDPLRKAPSAPADSAAAMTLSRNGIIFLRKG